MRQCIKVKPLSAKEILYYLFLIFCFIPFLFPNPIVKTNIQPYAALLGTLIMLFRNRMLYKSAIGRTTAILLAGTLLVALLVMLFSEFSMDAVRSVYNYYALFIVPCAVIIVLEDLDTFPEALCKAMILVWFLVASIQFFVYRGFATKLIGGVRWSYAYRGVVGLASEPSFLGISGYYFLHVVRKFNKNRVLFYAIVLVMGVLYAQSATALMFIAGYYVVLLLDMQNDRKGILIWAASIAAVIGFIIVLRTKLANSRLNQMINTLLTQGMDGILSDASASVRFNAIRRAFDEALNNRLLPGGFNSRIGSAYGSLLVEIGFFAFPAIFLISYSMSQSFSKKGSKIVYFIVVTLLLLNNTQIGNPLLLMVIGINLYSTISEKRKYTGEAIKNDVQIHQGT